MTSLRLVCPHDGVSTAQPLMRLLTAEQHSVDLCYGRDSLDHLDAARAQGGAVVLIWTVDAPTTLYMRQWADSIDPARLIEIARTPKAPPRAGRRASVIDFSGWNGLRGGPEWRALTDRLRVIARVNAPPRPASRHAVAAMGALSALAVGGAVYVRVDTALNASPARPEARTLQDVALTPIDDGMGGPLQAFEPLSIDEMEAPSFGPYARARPLAELQPGALAQTRVAPPMQFQRPTLMQRISSYAEPLLNRDDE